MGCDVETAKRIPKLLIAVAPAISRSRDFPHRFRICHCVKVIYRGNDSNRQERDAEAKVSIVLKR